MKFRFLYILLCLTFFACAPQPSPQEAVFPTTLPTLVLVPTAAEGIVPDNCELLPVIVPTIPAVIPGYTELDETTGLHMTGDVQEIDLESYRLKISGKVNFPLSLTYDEIRCMPKITAEPTLICTGVFEDVAVWSGVPLNYILNLAGVQEESKQVVLISADGYQSFFFIEEALQEQYFLAYEWEGEPLPILHGFPLRLVAPSTPGSNWVKWLVEIVVE